LKAPGSQGALLKQNPLIWTGKLDYLLSDSFVPNKIPKNTSKAVITKKVTPTSSGFNTAAARFQENDGEIALRGGLMVPGPGSYEASEMADGLMNTCWRKRIKDKFIHINKQKL